MTRALMVLSATIEMATGAAFLIAPGLAEQALLGQAVSGAGIAITRVAGLALLSLGLACWPGQQDITLQAKRALLIYNLLAALYLGYLRVAGGFESYLLWPASIFHAVLTVLLAIPNKRGARPEYLG